MLPHPIDAETFRELVEEFIPFNKHLGLKLERFDEARALVVTRLEMRPEFLGNAQRKMPHGGLVSFVIDATAGVAAALSLSDKNLIERISTIDMRVDYLKPAKGARLYTTSEVMRAGGRVIVVRSEVHDDAGTLVALGANVFNVSK